MQQMTRILGKGEICCFGTNGGSIDSTMWLFHNHGLIVSCKNDKDGVHRVDHVTFCPLFR
jgi:hypothetical protein